MKYLSENISALRRFQQQGKPEEIPEVYHYGRDAGNFTGKQVTTFNIGRE
ncbi:MAG: hypothetical protein LBJ01_09565 [Tannerella sp.]|jgi:hypothetical protein|nr:hypothetical protein [Tannerella sp.]